MQNRPNNRLLALALMAALLPSIALGAETGPATPGGATAAAQATGNASLSAIATQDTAIAAGIGTTADAAYTGSNTATMIALQRAINAKLGGTIAVSGTVGISGTVPISATALPLPSGAATSANQVTEISNLSTVAAQTTAAATSAATTATNTGGTAATGVTLPSGGTGLVGWVSGVYSKLGSILSALGNAANPVPIANYYYNGSSWAPSSAPVGSSSATPAYSAVVCGGSTVSQSAPCPISITEPSVMPFTVASTATQYVGLINASSYAYVEANIDLQAIGTGAVFTPQQSEDGINWHNITVGCFRGTGGIPIGGFNYVGVFQCQIQMTWFRWYVTGYTGGTYTGLTSFRTHRTSTAIVQSIPTASSGSGCHVWYHLSGGSTASTNSTAVNSNTTDICYLLITNTAASTAYFKLYDNPAAPTCSSAINLVQIIPVVAATTFQLMPPQGMYINSGLSFCIVGGPTDTDSSNGPAGVYVNISRQ